MATSANQEYDGVPLSALRKETRLKLSKYLDRKGMRLKVEIDNIPTDIFDDFTGLAKLAGQEDFIDTVKCQNQEQSPTGRLFDRLNDCGYTIETFLGYLLVMKRYDVIKDCIKLIVGDLLRFLDPKLVTRWNELSDDFESSSLSELLCVVNPKIAARWSKIFNDIENSYLSSSYHRWECFAMMKRSVRLQIKETTRNFFRSLLGRTKDDFLLKRYKLPSTVHDINLCKIYDYAFQDATISERLPIYVSDVIDYTFDAFVCYNQDDPGDKQFVQDLIEELEGRRGLRLYVPGRDDQPDASEHINNAGEIERRCRRVIIVMSRSYLQSTIWEFQEQFAQALLPDARRNRLITMLRERDVVLPEVLEGCNTLDSNEMNQVNWVLLRSVIRTPIREYMRSTNIEYLRNISFPRIADQTLLKTVEPARNVAPPNNNTIPKKLVPSQNDQPPLNLNESTEPITEQSDLRNISVPEMADITIPKKLTQSQNDQPSLNPNESTDPIAKLSGPQTRPLLEDQIFEEVTNASPSNVPQTEHAHLLILTSQEPQNVADQLTEIANDLTPSSQESQDTVGEMTSEEMKKSCDL